MLDHFDATFVVTAIVAAFGLIWGSYLNVVVYRLPRGLSTAVPGSHCPRCSSRIRAFDNVPVLSWLVLGARCRRCGGGISLRYPLVEAMVAAIFVLGFRRFDRPLEILVAWILGCVLLAVALIDYDRRVVPMVLTLPLGLAGWCLQPWLGWTGPWNALLTSLAAGALVFAASAGWRRLTSEAGFGAGDAHVLVLVGAFFGAATTFRVAFLALLAAAVSGGLLALAGRLDRRGLPLATFLGAAALWALLLDPGTSADLVRWGLR